MIEGRPADTSVSLRDLSRVAGLYFEALSGIHPLFQLLETVGAAPVPADTDDTIRLPAVIDYFENRRLNWMWYKTALSFRAMRYHPTLGTFATDPCTSLSGRDAIREFLSGFSSPSLARASFEVMEGVRLDAVLEKSLPGIRVPAARVRAHAAAGVQWPQGPTNSVQSQVLSGLILCSLIPEPRTSFVTPLVAATLRQAMGLLDSVAHGPPVDQSLLAASALYRLLSSLPPQDRFGGSESVTLRPPSVPSAPPSLVAVHGPASQAAFDSGVEGSELFKLQIPNVLYRGRIGSRHIRHGDTGRRRPPEVIVWRPGAVAPDQRGRDLQRQLGSGEETEEADGPPVPRDHEHVDTSRPDSSAALPVSVGRSNEFTYAEWDGIRGAYRQKWCRVLEEPFDSRGDPAFARRVLDVHGPTIRELLGQWGRLPTRGLETRKSLVHGDALDIDAAIRYRINVRAGAPATDRVYLRKVPARRDVACALLIDVSMSTADQAEPLHLAGATVDAEATYLYSKPYRTVLDHEREAAVVLMSVLDRMGDLVLVFTFSSSGRAQVRVQCVRDDTARKCVPASSRMAALTPVDGTRLGAAIRHAATRLGRTEARSKLLIIMSDGMPYDDDYGIEYQDRADEYALADTKMALAEAEQRGTRTAVFVIGNEDNDFVGALGHSAVGVSHPSFLPRAVVGRYLETLTAGRDRNLTSHTAGGAV